MSKPEQAQTEITQPTEAHDGEASRSRRDQLLLEFVRESDADPPDCPLCGYSLKGLTRPICPECGQQLSLAVGTPRFHLGWLFVAVAPCFFSGIAACFVLFLIVMHLIFIGSTWPVFIALDLFGWCSGAFAVILARKRPRSRFLALSRSRQRWVALLIWGIHIVALGMCILIGAYH